MGLCERSRSGPRADAVRCNSTGRAAGGGGAGLRTEMRLIESALADSLAVGTAGTAGAAATATLGLVTGADATTTLGLLAGTDGATTTLGLVTGADGTTTTLGLVANMGLGTTGDGNDATGDDSGDGIEATGEALVGAGETLVGRTMRTATLDPCAVPCVVNTLLKPVVYSKNVIRVVPSDDGGTAPLACALSGAQCIGVP